MIRAIFPKAQCCRTGRMLLGWFRSSARLRVDSSIEVAKGWFWLQRILSVQNKHRNRYKYNVSSFSI